MKNRSLLACSLALSIFSATSAHATAVNTLRITFLNPSNMVINLWSSNLNSPTPIVSECLQALSASSVKFEGWQNATKVFTNENTNSFIFCFNNSHAAPAGLQSLIKQCMASAQTFAGAAAGKKFEIQIGAPSGPNFDFNFSSFAVSGSSNTASALSCRLL